MVVREKMRVALSADGLGGTYDLIDDQQAKVDLSLCQLTCNEGGQRE